MHGRASFSGSAPYAFVRRIATHGKSVLRLLHPNAPVRQAIPALITQLETEWKSPMVGSVGPEGERERLRLGHVDPKTPWSRFANAYVAIDKWVLAAIDSDAVAQLEAKWEIAPGSRTGQNAKAQILPLTWKIYHIARRA
jgi:hypothetical protein